jgi:hypothetical protein
MHTSAVVCDRDAKFDDRDHKDVWLEPDQEQDQLPFVDHHALESFVLEFFSCLEGHEYFLLPFLKTCSKETNGIQLYWKIITLFLQEYALFTNLDKFLKELHIYDLPHRKRYSRWPDCRKSFS